MNGPRRGLAAMAVLILCVVAASCSRKPLPPPQMKLMVQSQPGVNKGQLFYMVVRDLNDRQFLTDSYQTVAGMVFADPPDKSILGLQVILPGKKHEFSVNKPVQNPAALYFMFTEPGEQWKRLVSQPLASAYDVRIDKGMVIVKPHKSLWRRILWPF